MSNRFGKNDQCKNCEYYSPNCFCPSPSDIAEASKEIRARREELGIDCSSPMPSEVPTDSAWVIFLAKERLKATITERVEKSSQALKDQA